MDFPEARDQDDFRKEGSISSKSKRQKETITRFGRNFNDRSESHERGTEYEDRGYIPRSTVYVENKNSQVISSNEVTSDDGRLTLTEDDDVAKKARSGHR